MNAKKRKNVTCAVVVGAVTFVTAAAVGIASSNGYGAYKNAIKNLLTSKNYTIDMSAQFEMDGKILGESTIEEKTNLDSAVKVHRIEKTKNYMEDSDVISDDGRIYEYIYQDGMEITGHTDYDTGKFSYIVNDIVNEYNQNVVPDYYMAMLTGRNDSNDKTADKVIRFGEIGMDLIVGDLKNNFIYEGTEDGMSKYSISLDQFQIPEIIRAGVDMVTTLNSAEMDLEDVKENVDRNPMQYFYKDVEISNASCEMYLGDDGNISKNVLVGVITGRDWDDNLHTLTFTLNINCSDFGTTEPDAIDISADNVELVSEQTVNRINELNKLLEDKDLSEEEREKYEEELKYTERRAKNFSGEDYELNTEEDSSDDVSIEIHRQ